MRGNASRHQRANNDQPSHFSYRFEVTSLDPPRCRQQQQRSVRVTMLEICTSTTAIWMQIMTTAPRAARRKPLRTSGNSARAQGRIWAHSRVSFGSHPAMFQGRSMGTISGHFRSRRTSRNFQAAYRAAGTHCNQSNSTDLLAPLSQAESDMMPPVRPTGRRMPRRDSGS